MAKNKPLGAGSYYKESSLWDMSESDEAATQRRADARSLAPYEQKAEEMRRGSRQGRGAGGIDVDIEGLPQRLRPSGGRRMKKGGKVSSASKRADGIVQRGKTKGRFV